MCPFGDFYRGKTVLVTGHTGFKGSWLAVWLHHLGAKVVGYALDPPTDPGHFATCRLEQRITHLRGEIRDYDQLQNVFREHRPEVVFHLAAQSLVRPSYRDPRQTFNINIMGTVNTLEIARQTDSVSTVVVVTSDKCYRNVEWEWGYRETDPLGGHDPYSASKACAELVVGSYQSPRFQEFTKPRRRMAIATTRAGNVIGGGDWAPDRLVPDIVRAIVAGRDIEVRHPNATRPWQHVLEALSGYLWLGSLMHENPDLYCSAWNFGPSEHRMLTAAMVVQHVLDRWSAPRTRLVVNPEASGGEAMLLRVDCSKASHHLNWQATWQIEQTLNAIVDWYKYFIENEDQDMFPYAVRQIEGYCRTAARHGLVWAGPAGT